MNKNTAVETKKDDRKIIRLLCIKRSHKTKDGTRTFSTFRTSILVPVKGEEEKGPQIKSVDLRFGKDIPTSTLEKLKGRNYIYAFDSDVACPEIYDVKDKIDEKTGVTKKVYPHVYVQAIKGFERTLGKKPVQNQFVTDEEGTGEYSSLDGDDIDPSSMPW